jgi:hypothetical protein
MTIGKRFLKLLSIGTLVIAHALPGQSAEVSGVKIPDTATVGGKELVLNGAGMRVKFVINVYAMGLYLSKKETAPADVLAQDGPKRVSLTMMREVDSDEFGQLFITSMNANSDKAEKAKYFNQTVKFGEMFASLGKVKKGDIVTLDWIPGTGTISSVNGKQQGEAFPDSGFYSAVLRIWLGEKPADSSLKPLLLGGK